MSGRPDGAPRDAERAAVLRRSLSIGLAVGAYGVSFGALGTAAGLTVAQTCALSLLMFSGGSQFALTGVLGAGGSGVAAVATATLIGVRNGFYGLQMAPLVLARPRGGWRRLVAAQLTIDESTAVGWSQAADRPDRPELARLGFWVTGGVIYLVWNLTTLLGALAGNRLGDPRRYGLDAAAAAAFLALVWPRLRGAGPLRAGLAAVVVALATVPLVPAGVPVLLAGAAALLAGAPSRDGAAPDGGGATAVREASP